MPRLSRITPFSVGALVVLAGACLGGSSVASAQLAQTPQTVQTAQTPQSAPSAPAPAPQSVRSPAEYLRDFRRLFESGDISDYRVVGDILRMPVTPQVGEAVDSSQARGNAPIAGTSRDFRRAGPAPEYLEYPFLYGDFVPGNRGPARVVINVYLDKSKVCITPADLEAGLGPMRAAPLTDGAGMAYGQDIHGKNDLSATFMIFSDSTCVERVGLTQNIPRVQ